MTNQIDNKQLTSILFSIGWTPQKIAEAMGCVNRNIYYAFQRPECKSLRRKIENLVGHPLFSDPYEFAERKESIARLGADIESLKKQDALALSKRLGLVLPENPRLSQILEALRRYDSTAREVVETIPPSIDAILGSEESQTTEISNP